jgi:hypothetical protein
MRRRQSEWTRPPCRGGRQAACKGRKGSGTARIPHCVRSTLCFRSSSGHLEPRHSAAMDKFTPCLPPTTIWTAPRRSPAGSRWTRRRAWPWTRCSAARPGTAPTAWPKPPPALVDAPAGPPARHHDAGAAGRGPGLGPDRRPGRHGGDRRHRGAQHRDLRGAGMAGRPGPGRPAAPGHPRRPGAPRRPGGAGAGGPAGAGRRGAAGGGRPGARRPAPAPGGPAADR